MYIDNYLDDTTCEYLIDKQDFYCHIVFLLFILLISCLGKNVMNYFRDIMFTWFAVEYIIYNVAFMNLWYKIDMLTVYLFVWQLISLGLNWMRFELFPPIFIIEQGSFCIMAALIASIMNFIYLRYLPREIILVVLCLFSLCDM